MSNRSFIPMAWSIILLVGMSAMPPSGQNVSDTESMNCPESIAAWCAEHGPVTSYIIELNQRPTKEYEQHMRQTGSTASIYDLKKYTQELVEYQDEFLKNLQDQHIDALLCTTRFEQENSVIHQVEYRFTYTRNGIVAYVDNDDVARLRQHPQVRTLSRPATL